MYKLMVRRFFEHYHPFLPFLQEPISPDECYQSGVCLFWVIISVASRRYEDDLTLRVVLADWVIRLLWHEISKPPYRLSTIQALIILNSWPFPTSSTCADPSATFSSIAISAAMQIGLHNPVHAGEFHSRCLVLLTEHG